MTRRWLAPPLLLAALFSLTRCAAKEDPAPVTPPAPADKFTFEGTEADGGFYAAFGAALVVDAEHGGARTWLQITEFGHACDEFTRIHRGTRYVEMRLARKVALADGGYTLESPSDAGTLVVWDGGTDFSQQPETFAQVTVFRTSEVDCAPQIAPGDVGASGQVVIENLPKLVGGGAYGAFDVPMKGSFDVLLKSGGKLKGTFALPRCAPYEMTQTCF
jgi:hypothetical protein